MPTLIVTLVAFVAFASGVAVKSGALLPPADPLAPIPGYETRYVLVGGDAPVTVKRGEYDSYLSACSNSSSRTPKITPGFEHVRVFVCEL